MNVLSSYRPLSKLLAEVLEKVIFNQPSFLDKYNICESFQLGFRAFHSSESVLFKATKAILLDDDSSGCYILVLI